ncbi:MAG: site-specific integrase, partial [Oscillospiraceae bacterium]|nr:site-specific integrase [Oscillospiraceae bacterium]
AKAYITPQKDGRFIVQIKIGYKPDGRPDRKSLSFRSEAEALAQQAAWNEAFAHLSPTRSSPVEVAPALDSAPVLSQDDVPNAQTRFVDTLFWYYKSDDVTCGDKCLRNYFDHIRLIERTLEQMGEEDKEKGISSGVSKDITLGAMTEKIAKRIIKTIASRCAQPSVDRSRNIIKKVIKTAFLRDYVDYKDFSDLLFFVKSKNKYTQLKSLSDEEVNMLISLAKGHNDMLYTIVVVLNGTGMRPEELCALRWSSVNWTTREITVTNAIVTEYEGLREDTKGNAYNAIGNTKSERGVRRLPLCDETFEALTAWQKISEKKGSKYIFYNRSRKHPYLTYDALKGRWTRFLEANGLWTGKEEKKELNIFSQEYKLYRFRKTYCTRLMRSMGEVNIDLPHIQYVMGDSTLDVIMEHYADIKAKDSNPGVRNILNKSNKRNK